MKKLAFVKFKCEDDNLDDIYFVGKDLAKIMSGTGEYRPRGMKSMYHETQITVPDLGCFRIRFAAFQKPKKVSQKEIRALWPKDFDEALGKMRSGIYDIVRINTPKQLLESSATTVHISGWTRDRQLVYRPSHIRLQVTLFECNNCSACIRRVKELQEFLATRASVTHRWEYRDKAQWLVFKRQSGESPLQILRNILKTEVKAMSYGREL